MKYIGYILLLISAFLLIGTVGGIEHGTMPMAEGMVQSIIYLALIVVGTKIIEKYEEKEND